MIGSWRGVVIGAVAALVLACTLLVAVLAAARPRGGLLGEALWTLPDVLRLVRRLAADDMLPRGVPVRLVCCWPTWPCRST
jgi:hypothetical protein